MHLKQKLQVSTLFAIAASAAQLPPPPGPFNISLAIQELVDYGRVDPFAPVPQPRSLMVSVFEPANCSETTVAPYMPPLTATFYAQNVSQYNIPKDAFKNIQIPVCSSYESYQGLSNPDQLDEEALCETQDAPVILFSPGLGAIRFLYNAIAAAIASYGFTVVTIDHPYDGTIVEYPDGHAVYAVVTGDNQTQLLEDVQVRAQDASFVVDQLSLLTTRDAGATSKDKVFMAGHSLGGATTAAAMANDSRIIGGVDLDGELFGDVVNDGLSQPFMIFTHENITNPTWDEVWPRLRGFKRQLELLDSQHLTFCDAAEDLQTLGLTNLTNALVPVLGSLPGERAVDIVSAYISAFAEYAFDGVEDDILKGPTPRFPEVSFTR